MHEQALRMTELFFLKKLLKQVRFFLVKRQNIGGLEYKTWMFSCFKETWHPDVTIEKAKASAAKL